MATHEGSTVTAPVADMPNDADDSDEGRATKVHQRMRALWTSATGATGVAMGIAPHVLHHVGPLVGTALVAGVGGTILFGVLGLVASLPMLLKLKRKFRSWWAPAMALGLFAAAFVISTTVLGPLISGEGETPDPAPTRTVVPDGHDTHH